jgi:hypothetical protein
MDDDLGYFGGNLHIGTSSLGNFTGFFFMGFPWDSIYSLW